MTYEKVKISELVSMRGGGTPKTDIDEYWGGDVQWLTPTEISDGEIVYVESTERNPTQEGIDNSSAKILPEGTVLMTSRATVGVPVINRKEMATNQGFISMRTTDRLYNLYLFYWIKNNRERIKRRATGSTYDEISQTQMKEFEIQLPPINEQKKIANLIYTIDRKIELNRELAELLEKTAYAIYESWFEAYEPYDISDNQEYPKEFEKYSISEVLDVKYGYAFDSDMFNQEEQGEPLIRIRNISDGYTDTYTTEEYDDEYRLNTGDVVAGLDGTFKPDIWRGRDGLLNQRVVRFRPTERILNSKMYTNLSTKTPFKKMSRQATGTTVEHIHKKDIDNSDIIVPDKESVKRFKEITEPMFKDIVRIESENRKLDQLRDYLLPQLMSGEVIIQKSEDETNEEKDRSQDDQDNKDK